MKKFKSLFKSIRGKSSGKNELSEDDRTNSSGAISNKTLSGLKKVMAYLEATEQLPGSIYGEPGFIEELRPVETLINGGSISEAYLGTVRSVHSIAMGVINVLRSHDPVVPYDLYDHLLSPMADLSQLLQQIVARSAAFVPIMKHLTALADSGRSSDEINDMDLAASVGVVMLRSLSDDMAGNEMSDSYELQTRIKVFAALMQQFREVCNSQGFSSDTQCSTPRLDSHLDSPLSTQQQQQQRSTLMLPPAGPSSQHQQMLTPLALPPGTPAMTPGATTLASSSAAGPFTGSIQERSVKVLFLAAPQQKPTKEELTALVQRYGTINNVRQPPAGSNCLLLLQ